MKVKNLHQVKSELVHIKTAIFQVSLWLQHRVEKGSDFGCNYVFISPPEVVRPLDNMTFFWLREHVAEFHKSRRRDKIVPVT